MTVQRSDEGPCLQLWAEPDHRSIGMRPTQAEATQTVCPESTTGWPPRFFSLLSWLLGQRYVLRESYGGSQWALATVPGPQD